MRVLIAVVPFGCAIAVGALLARLLPAPTSPADEVLATLLVAVGSMLAYVVPQRAARRLLPLAALLDLTLSFPDTTPSRFRVALRAQSARRIKEQLSRSLEGGPPVSRSPGAPAGQAAADLVGLLAALTLHDPQVRGHSERVRAYTAVIADELDLEESARNRLAWAALLHDVGKIAVPREILRKVTPLTEEEWTLVRAHTVIGDRLIQPLAEWLGEFALVPLQHHERWDGSGYPRGLIGEHISAGARIVAVADAYDVMTSVRSYHTSLDPEAARRELVACAGQQFDPAVVRAFLNAGLRPAGSRTAALLPVGTLTTLLDAIQVRLRLLPPTGAFAAAGSAVVAAGLSGLLPVRIQPVEDIAQGPTRPAAVGEPAAPGTQVQRNPFATTGDMQVVDDVPASAPVVGAAPATSNGSKSAAASTSPALGASPATNPHLTEPQQVGAAPLALPAVSVPVVNVPAVNVPAVNLPPLGVPPVALPPVSVPAVAVTIPQLPSLSLPGLSLPAVSIPAVSLPDPVSVAVPLSQPAPTAAPAGPPAAAAPPVSVPPVSVPPVSAPPVSVPPVSVPPVSVPPVSAPTTTAPPPALASVSTPPSLPATPPPLVSTPHPAASPPAALLQLPGR